MVFLGEGLRADPGIVGDTLLIQRDRCQQAARSSGWANKRSIAWAIAQAGRAGARLAVTYQGERLEENVRELAAALNDPLILPLDVTDDAQIDERRSPRSTRVRRPRLRRARRGLRAARGAGGAVRPDVARGFRMSLDISAYSLVALARGALPLMERRGGGSILTLTYLGSERVFQNYNVMGVAKAALEATVRYLAADLGPKSIRVNAISAGPIKTLAASGISGFSSILQLYRDRAPLRRTVETARWPTRRCSSSEPPAARSRRSPDGRRRLSRDRHVACTGCSGGRIDEDVGGVPIARSAARVAAS